MKMKRFNCVKMVREARDRIYNGIKGLSTPEKIAWFERKAREWKESHQRGKAPKNTKVA